MKRLLCVLSVTFLLVVGLTGCTVFGTPLVPTPTPSPAPQPLTLTSSAFESNAVIPARYSCHGDNLSPPLAWNIPPSGTQSFVLVMDDPDAVKVVGRVWDHWLLFNIPPTVLSLSEGVPQQAELPDGSRHGQNSSRALGYGGPCPPGGQTHAYQFRLYAVDMLLGLKSGATKAEIMQALDGHTLAQAQLVGQYASP